MLDIRNVNKNFGDKVVLKDLNLSIQNGSVFGLVGINGAGKSTLLRCISGILKLDSGQILMDNAQVYDNPRVKKDILFIGDDLYYPNNATIQSLKYFYGQFYQLDMGLFDKYVAFFHLDPKKRINSFSKGMKRQVFLILALSIQFKILILDEAFDGLDPLIRIQFKKELGKLIYDEERIIIISSHNLKELEDVCDCYGLLDGGNIKTSGDLMESKGKINKYQVVFKEDVDIHQMDLEILDIKMIGKVYNLVIKGDEEMVMEYLQQFQPLLLEVININFEELFIYEVKENAHE
ncbi:MAG: ABC transporter ATP-binding protein [Erysipelotrichaceae bacterium]|nr:ABC transporter ATP-binding protein [Erysipelotrichaceae bacterium]